MLNVCIFSFVIIICSIIIREYHDYELEDIKHTIDEILEENWKNISSGRIAKSYNMY